MPRSISSRGRRKRVSSTTSKDSVEDNDMEDHIYKSPGNSSSSRSRRYLKAREGDEIEEGRPTQSPHARDETRANRNRGSSSSFRRTLTPLPNSQRSRSRSRSRRGRSSRAVAGTIPASAEQNRDRSESRERRPRSRSRGRDRGDRSPSVSSRGRSNRRSSSRNGKRERSSSQGRRQAQSSKMLTRSAALVDEWHDNYKVNVAGDVRAAEPKPRRAKDKPYSIDEHLNQPASTSSPKEGDKEWNKKDKSFWNNNKSMGSLDLDDLVKEEGNSSPRRKAAMFPMNSILNFSNIWGESGNFSLKGKPSKPLSSNQAPDAHRPDPGKVRKPLPPPRSKSNLATNEHPRGAKDVLQRIEQLAFGDSVDDLILESKKMTLTKVQMHRPNYNEYTKQDRNRSGGRRARVPSFEGSPRKSISDRERRSPDKNERGKVASWAYMERPFPVS